MGAQGANPGHPVYVPNHGCADGMEPQNAELIPSALLKFVVKQAIKCMVTTTGICDSAWNSTR